MSVHTPMKPGFFRAVLIGGWAKTVFLVEEEVSRKERKMVLKRQAIPKVYSENYILHSSGWRIYY